MTKDRRNRAWHGKLDKDGFIHRRRMITGQALVADGGVVVTG